MGVLKQEKKIVVRNFKFYDQVEFHAQLSWAWKNVL